MIKTVNKQAIYHCFTCTCLFELVSPWFSSLFSLLSSWSYSQECWNWIFSNNRNSLHRLNFVPLVQNRTRKVHNFQQIDVTIHHLRWRMWLVFQQLNNFIKKLFFVVYPYNIRTKLIWKSHKIASIFERISLTGTPCRPGMDKTGSFS
jgi:hypothetical protein